MALHTGFIPDYETEYLLTEAIEQYYTEVDAQRAYELAPIYYAHYRDVAVEAMVVGPWAILTTPEADGALLVSATDPLLVLHGRKDLADLQKQKDGDLIRKACGY